ncbi:uncharacterized protein SCHCODRAFT_02118324, partial [Schizophyllum commune H4-8]|uniref:uncharacterized protein n=1 Tax=Schizophyllum commune (strain H4-8 / FGSC 9210) TaxID=578458 RepID=UPI00215DE196
MWQRWIVRESIKWRSRSRQEIARETGASEARATRTCRNAEGCQNTPLSRFESHGAEVPRLETEYKKDKQGISTNFNDVAEQLVTGRHG